MHFVRCLLTVVLVLAAPAGCTTPPQGAYPLAKRIDVAHGGDVFRSARAVQCDFDAEFDGRRLLHGALIYETTGKRAQITLSDGTMFVTDGETTWISPAAAASPVPSAAYHLEVWPRFLSAPAMLYEPGTILKLAGDRMLQGRPYQTARLTSESQVGDQPKDWQLFYADPESRRVHAMAYQLIRGRNVPYNSRDPHIVTYDDFINVGGAVIATTWRFWSFSETEGITGEPIGLVKLENIKFVHPIARTFGKPKDAREEAR
jgi:hypothetical protein